MRQAPSLDRVGAARVCAELDPRLSDLKGDVLLAHHEEDRANSPALGEHQVERGIDPILALVFGDVVQVPATVLPILNRTESEEEGALGRRERAEILPVCGLVFDLVADPLACFGIREVVEKQAICRRPWREACRELAPCACMASIHSPNVSKTVRPAAPAAAANIAGLAGPLVADSPMISVVTPMVVLETTRPSPSPKKAERE